MSRLIYDSAALQEYEDAVEYYKDIDLELAKRFRNDVLDAVKGISKSPLQWPIYVDDVRRRVLSDFPYIIFYLTSSELITIVAIVHSSREPDNWLGRSTN